jgi:hypothetical protein
MKSCVALVVFCALSIPAFPASQLSDSGNDFLSECSTLDKEASSLTNVEMLKNLSCVFYIRGLMDGTTYEDARILAESSVKLKLPAYPFCLPAESVQFLQLGRVVLKYIRDNPEKAHLQTSVLVFAAVRNAFPCSK